MNVKELAEQAGFDKHHVEYDTRIERFAELVRQDYAKQFITDAERDENIRSEERRHCAEDYLKIMRDAVAREREVCAKLCDEKALYFQYDFIPPYDVADSCAEEIRARGKE